MADERPPRFVMSPVDYEAWGKGYMPPTNHVLIDQLMFRDARVVLSVDMGPNAPAYWLVVRGKPLKGKKGTLIMQMIEDALADENDEPVAEPATEPALAEEEPPS
jgi:hypothetical protein